MSKLLVEIYWHVFFWTTLYNRWMTPGAECGTVGGQLAGQCGRSRRAIEASAAGHGQRNVATCHHHHDLLSVKTTRQATVAACLPTSALWPQIEPNVNCSPIFIRRINFCTVAGWMEEMRSGDRNRGLWQLRKFRPPAELSILWPKIMPLDALISNI